MHGHKPSLTDASKPNNYTNDQLQFQMSSVLMQPPLNSGFLHLIQE
jgi:hypothetical protein